MELGINKDNNKIYVIHVYEKETLYKICKKAYLLALQGEILELQGDNVKYKFGVNINNGTMNYDCFFTLEEALERINSLNDYFEKNNYLLEEK